MPRDPMRISSGFGPTFVALTRSKFSTSPRNRQPRPSTEAPPLATRTSITHKVRPEISPSTSSPSVPTSKPGPARVRVVTPRSSPPDGLKNRFARQNSQGRASVARTPAASTSLRVPTVPRGPAGTSGSFDRAGGHVTARRARCPASLGGTGVFLFSII